MLSGSLPKKNFWSPRTLTQPAFEGRLKHPFVIFFNKLVWKYEILTFIFALVLYKISERTRRFLAALGILIKKGGG